MHHTSTLTQTHTRAHTHTNTLVNMSQTQTHTDADTALSVCLPVYMQLHTHAVCLSACVYATTHTQSTHHCQRNVTDPPTQTVKAYPPNILTGL